jgi:hypothetical protein
MKIKASGLVRINKVAHSHIPAACSDIKKYADNNKRRTKRLVSNPPTENVTLKGAIAQVSEEKIPTL